MSRIIPIDPYRLIKILGKLGFKPIRQRGSHVLLMDRRGTRIVVPVHPGRRVKPGLVRIIIAEAGVAGK